MFSMFLFDSKMSIKSVKFVLVFVPLLLILFSILTELKKLNSFYSINFGQTLELVQCMANGRSERKLPNSNCIVTSNIGARSTIKAN